MLKIWRTRRNIPIYGNLLSMRHNRTGNKYSFPEYFSGFDYDTLSVIHKNFQLHENFVSKEEEMELIAEIDSLLKRRRYEINHWDGAITEYKETEKMDWNFQNNQVLQRVRDLAFTSKCSQIKHVHVLDLAKQGYIKPHVDSIKFCGDTIAGLSLISSSVMKLAMENNKEKCVDVLLSRRSLYIMKGAARYDFTHEILQDTRSFFKDVHVPRDRRVSIICRNEPN